MRRRCYAQAKGKKLLALVEQPAPAAPAEAAEQAAAAEAPTAAATAEGGGKEAEAPKVRRSLCFEPHSPFRARY